MAAPAALALSKLFYPETEQSKTTVNDIHLEKGYVLSFVTKQNRGKKGKNPSNQINYFYFFDTKKKN